MSAFARPPPRPQWVEVRPNAVPRIDAREFVGRGGREKFEALSLETPLVLTHAFEAVERSSSSSSTPPLQLRRFATDEAFADRFFETFTTAEVSYQRKGNARGARPELFDGPLAEVVAAMMTESHHDKSLYLLSEDLLDTAPEAEAALRSPLTLPPALFGKHDYFDLFPKKVRPKKNCAILGGPGARSFLHADPYEWQGLNYLFEGQKVWAFVRPSPATERALGLQRVAPDAWDGAVGAGWKSDTVDLYHVEPRITDDGNVRLGLLPALAGAVPEEDMLACVQEEGELVVIPPRWSHQVYHLTPALALAWQVCTRATLPRVLRHVLEYCKEGGGGNGDGGGSTILDEVMHKTPPGIPEEAEEELVWARAKITATLQRALELRYGREKGSREWARLNDEGN